MMGFNDIQPQVLAALLVDKTFKNALDTAIETALHSNLTKEANQPNQVENRNGWACCNPQRQTTSIQENTSHGAITLSEVLTHGQPFQTPKQIVDGLRTTINADRLSAGISPLPDYTAEIDPLGVHAQGVDAYLTGTLNTTGTENIMQNARAQAQPAEMINVVNGYKPLALVLALALEQAQNGKGNERHQVGATPFIQQPICAISRLYGVGYNFGQAAKKAHETEQLTSLKSKQAELLGAINYLAAAYIVLSEQE